ncbi:MAG: CDP-alcohol phosphatidyltransferase family protein [Pyrinomonadaceae bacterium]
MLEVGASIGRGAMRIINGMVRGLASLGVPPNILTIIGVAINIFCGVLFGTGNFFGAGIVLIVANLFDMLDGNVARMTGRVTRYGGFLDSTLDRMSDMGAFLGVMVFYARITDHHSTMNVFLGGVGMIMSVLVSYATARSEALGVKANVGFLQRPERVVLLIIGALSTWNWSSENWFANRMPQVLWVLAVGSLWTFIQRMRYIRGKLKELDGDI